MFVDSQSWGFRRKTMTLFEVREEWEGWLANETAQCRKQNNLQKRCCSPLHLPCLQRELSSQSCVPAKATAQELFSSSPAFLRTLCSEKSPRFVSISGFSLIKEGTTHLPLRGKLQEIIDVLMCFQRGQIVRKYWLLFSLDQNVIVLYLDSVFQFLFKISC